MSEEIKPVTWLKRKYSDHKSIKNQKATSGNSGKNKHKKDAKNKGKTQGTGQKVFLLNMSSQEKYCASTGVLLPRRGMVVLHQGEYYIGYDAAAKAG